MSDSPIQSLFSWEDGSGATQVLNVDVVMSLSDKRSAKLTDYVVETGSVITDHVVIQPETLSMDLIVTQTPLRGPGMTLQKLGIESTSQQLAPQQYPLNVPPSRFQPGGFLLLSQGLRTVITAGANALLGAVGLAAPDGSRMTGSVVRLVSTSANPTTLQADAKVDRVVAVHDQLVSIMEGKLLVTVSFKGKLYVDYLITDIDLSHQAGAFGRGSFKVQARAFRTVTGVAAQLPSPADFRAKASVKKGNKPGITPDPDPTKAAQAQSLISRGAEGAAQSPLGTALLGAVGLN